MSSEHTDQEIREKILHVLGIYPVISPTMLQAGLGPYTKPARWRPILQELIEAKKVIESQVSLQTPSDRYNTYTLLQLPDVEIKWP